jgi:predicted RNA-binding Zn ribbon-like protein
MYVDRSNSLNSSLIGGHPVLDFLNTKPQVAGDLVELLAEPQDVVRRLKQANLLPNATSVQNAASLPAAAQKLREVIRGLVEKRKIGVRWDVHDLNEYLEQAQSYPQIVWDMPRVPRIERVRQAKSVGQVLAPLAEAAAELLVVGDFEKIRRCEGKACVLWFVDNTRSHHRRFCSPTTCGNRAKVAAFRRRKRASK